MNVRVKDEVHRTKTSTRCTKSEEKDKHGRCVWTTKKIHTKAFTKGGSSRLPPSSKEGVRDLR